MRNGPIGKFLKVIIRVMYASVDLMAVLMVNTKQTVANAKIVQPAMQMNTFLAAVLQTETQIK